ncbi:hypothetical protein POM88_018321 [Heracleum sosnowskyi]|uniref:Uncharacterized protein n=1 Tax=Heracleum sosnowskyi TaxID=360622 RepID=A0AAD8IS41_9APIA|nr:hypothetical protein POM88_018321 [Heracleum sosnowskyi]
MSKNQKRRKEKETRKMAKAFARLKVEEETSKNKNDEEREDSTQKAMLSKWKTKITTKSSKFSILKSFFLFLYLKNQRMEGDSCGELGFNMFVTPKGRGKVLPSLDPFSNGMIDVNDLISGCIKPHNVNILMTYFDLDYTRRLGATSRLKTRRLVAMRRLKIKDVEFGLPQELHRLFSDVHHYIEQLPPSFLVDHPFFWIVCECIDFIDKFYKLLIKEDFRKALQIVLRSDRVVNRWSDKLDGIYIKIWEKGDPRRSKSTRSTQAKELKSTHNSQSTGLEFTHSSQSTGIESAHSTQSTGVIKFKIYQKNIDIVTFYATTYKHVNDSEYKQYRRDKEFDDDEVEKDLSKFFSNFYVDMFAKKKLLSQISS